MHTFHDFFNLLISYNWIYFSFCVKLTKLLELRLTPVCFDSKVINFPSQNENDRLLLICILQNLVFVFLCHYKISYAVWVWLRTEIWPTQLQYTHLETCSMSTSFKSLRARSLILSLTHPLSLRSLSMYLAGIANVCHSFIESAYIYIGSLELIKRQSKCT